MRVLVLGGGAIGTCTAYWLASRGAAVTLVERHAIAGAASGKSGGFLALDWCDGTPVMALARRSFALHATLSHDLGGGWGYRAMNTFAGTIGAAAGSDTPSIGLPGWIGSEVRLHGRLGTTATTAQVQPADFAAGMMGAARRHGAQLHPGRVEGLLRDGERVVGAIVGGEALHADATVIAMGPWSVLATQWLALPPVFGLKGHSLVFDTQGALPPDALFLETAGSGRAALTPEVFPRADGTTYVCAISTEPPLPIDPAQVVPDEGAIEQLRALCTRIAPALAQAPVLKAGACFRPITPDGLPLIGKVPDAPGAFVATGHSVWGILNAPATGEAMAELILDGETRAVDLSAFDPARLPPLDPGRLATGAPRQAGRADPAVSS